MREARDGGEEEVLSSEFRVLSYNVLRQIKKEIDDEKDKSS